MPSLLSLCVLYLSKAAISALSKCMNHCVYIDKSFLDKSQRPTARKFERNRAKVRHLRHFPQ